MAPKDAPQTSSNETLEQLLQAAAAETDSDKLPELFRKIVSLIHGKEIPPNVKNKP